MRKSLKAYIFIFLLFLLLLATALTFLLTSFFWFQEVTRLYAEQKEGQIRLLGHHYFAATGQRSKNVLSVAELLATALARTEASGGCALLESGRVFCSEQIASRSDTMRALLKSATVDQRSSIALVGVAWLGSIPTRQYLDLAVPLRTEELNTTLVLRYSLAPIHEELEPLLRYTGIYLLVNLLVLLVVGFFRMHRDVLRPIEKLIHSADAYTEKEGLPFLPLSLPGRDEFGQLGYSIQRMLHRIHSDREKLERNLASLEEAHHLLLANQKEMVRTEKLSSLGQLAAGLAHEIGNPLGIVQGYLGLLRDEGLASEQRSDYLNRAEKELERISHLIRQLLDYARPTSGDQVVNVHEVLRDVLDLLRPQPLLRGISLSTQLLAQPVLVCGNPAQLTQVFLNCLINAADAIHARSATGQANIEITSTLEQEKGKTMLRIEIADTGTGLTDPVLASALDPFFTTKDHGQGTGLGLSVSSALLRDMGGDIRLANRAEGGALVTIFLPLNAPDQAADSTISSSGLYGKK